MSKLGPKELLAITGQGRVESEKGVLKTEKTCIKIKKKRKNLKEV